MEAGAGLVNGGAVPPRSAATLPLGLKRTQPWHLTALMSFLGIAAGAVKGLLNWGSETLPCETMYSGSQQ